MPDSESKVWVSSRKCKTATTYHIRWIDPATHKWKSRAVGTSRKRADREAAMLERELDEGTYRNVRRASWEAFVDDHVAKIPGKANAAEARRTLEEFGKVCCVTQPRRVTFSTIERYVAWLRKVDEDEGKKSNSTATINKKLRYLRAGFNRAVQREYLAKSPMTGWRWEREDHKQPRTIDSTEETALLDKAEELYGSRWRALIVTALGTGGRRGELLALTWSRVDFKGSGVLFVQTKGKRDRAVPVNADVLETLRRLQPSTLIAGGPFIGMADNLGREWGRIREAAEVPDVSLHDLRRSYVTRLIRAGVPLPTVQRLCGHADIKTTLTHYNWVSDDDLREGVAKLSQVAAG